MINVLALSGSTLDLSGMLTGATSVLTWLTTSVMSVFGVVTQSPIAMVFIYCALIGVAVGFAKKLLHI